jgi:hypothetical protein
MYTTYIYKAGSTAANILADVIKLLTGTTDQTLLSGDCVQASTSLVTIEPAGWEMWDAAAGVDAVGLRAVVSDDPTKHKYVVIDTNTAGYIFIKVYEYWNNITHVGTNVAYGCELVGYAQRLNVTNGGRLDIRATIRTIVMFSFQGGAYGSSTGSAPSGIVERTRASLWDTVENGYPKFLFVAFYLNTSGSSCFPPRSLGVSGQDVFANFAGYSLASVFGSQTTTAFPLSPQTYIPNAQKIPTPFIAPLSVVSAARGDLGGEMSSLCGFYLTVGNYGAAYDTLTIGGQQYIIWSSGNYRTAIRVA